MRYAILFLLSFSASAALYDENDWNDPALSGMRPRAETSSPSSRYFGGGNDPAVVVPIQPGSGPSLIGRDQIMTDHQYCFRSVVSGALVCQSH